MKNSFTCCCQLAISKLGKCGSNFMTLLMLLFLFVAMPFNGKAANSPPACNIVGPLTACTTHNPNDTTHDIVIYITVARSTSTSTISYSFFSNSSGAFIRKDLHGTILQPNSTATGVTVAQAAGVYNINTNMTFDTLVVFPGTQGFEFNLQVNDTTRLPDNNTCECSKSVSVSDIDATLSAPPILCYGGNTTLSVLATGAAIDGFGNVNYYDSLYAAGVHYPNGVTGSPNPNSGSATFSTVTAGNYTLTVYSPVDECKFDTLISISQPPYNPVILHCPQDQTVTSCQTQAAVDAEYATWLASFSFDGGTNAQSSNNSTGAPLACGGSKTVTWTVTSLCQTPQTCSATFTVPAAPTVTLTCPQNLTVNSCQTQAAVNAEFAAWLATATHSGGCNPQFSNNAEAAPLACGGAVTVTWTLTSDCDQPHTCQATFTVPNAPAVTLTCPQALTVASCQTQAAVNAEFTAWLATVQYGGGCNAQISNDNTGAPLACGGSKTVTWTVTSDCDAPHSCQATFTVPTAPVVTLTCPQPLTVNSCQTQAAVNAEFAAWLATVQYGGGCNAQISNDNTGAPLACGGSKTVTWTVTSDCDAPHTCQSTFTVPNAPVVTLTCPQPLTVASCQTQAAVNAEFAAWLATVQYGGGCNAQISNDNTGAPLACGGSKTVTWTVTSDCDAPHTCQATFTVPNAPVVTLTCPQSLTVNACQTQAAVDAEFAAWLATVQYGGGCNAQIRNDNNGAPLACGGSKTVTWTVTSDCDAPHTCQATFTVPNASAVTLTCPQNLTLPSCQDQATIDAAFATWLASATASGGCNGHLTNNNEGSPAACGGSTTVTFTYSTDCDDPHTCQATFSVNFPDEVAISCPGNETVNACQTQAAVNAEFAAWLATAHGTGGCNGQLTYGEPTAPLACGGQTVVTFNYTANGYMRSGNLIVNGDFSGGYSGFSSSYIYVSPAANQAANGAGLYPEGYFAVDSDAADYHPNFAGRDHTTGNGAFFMIINGSGTPNTEVWGQTINGITPNTNYEFSTWVTSVNPASQALLNFSINGTVVGNQFMAPTTVGDWIKFQTTWNSGSSTSATISIVNQNTTLGGNDFGLDDISFAPSNAVCAPITRTCIDTFTVPATTPVSLTCAQNLTVNSCQTQAAVNAEFAAWLATASYSGGCNPQFSNNNTGAPLACGGSKTVTWTVTSDCEQPRTCSATFTVPNAPAVTLTCPQNSTVNSCQTQAAVDAEFAAWLATASYSGGCNASISNNNNGAPLACGGSKTVTFTVTSDCDAPHTCSATFTVPAAPSVVFTRATDLTVASCQTQAAVNAEFAAWLASASVSGGCNAHISNDNTGAPLACGGSKTVIWTVTSDCGPTQTCMATFTVPTATPVVLTVPANTTSTACQSQTAIDAAFAAWLASASVSGGCNAHITNDANGAPRTCGGTVKVHFTATSDCQAAKVDSATFTVPGATPVVLTCPQNLTVNACLTQTQVNAAFAAWLATATFTGGCNPSFMDDNTGAPYACGGSTTVTFMVMSDCEPMRSCQATFTVPTVQPLTLNVPQSTTVASCQTQAAVNAEFAAWLATASIGGGCNASLTNDNTGAPLACGGSVKVHFTASSLCQSTKIDSATFTVPAAPSVVFTRATDLTVASCQTQAAVNAEFAAWLATASVSGGCNAHISNDNTGAPSACGGAKTVIWTVTSDCGQTQTCMATFTVPTPSTVTINLPEPLTVTACQTQASVDAQLAAWLATASVSGGCNAHLTNDAGTVSACGGVLTVHFTATSDCQSPVTGSATFTVPAGPTLVFNRATDLTVASCQPQASVDAEFAAWLASVTISGGCNAQLTNDLIGGGPAACGGSKTVTWTVTSNCGQPLTNTATFTVPAPGPVVLHLQNDTTIASCQSQTAIDAAFAAWVAEAYATGGCVAHITNDAGSAPLACGGSVTVNYTGFCGCAGTVYGSRTFTVTPTSTLVLSCPSDLTVASCQTQAAVDAEFAAWLTTAKISGGCNGTLNDNHGAAPLACGGSVTVTFRTSSDCDVAHTCQATFTVTPDNQKPTFTLTAASALPTNPTRAQIEAAFGSASASDNCTQNLTPSSNVGPEVGEGCIRSTTKYWTVADNCGNQADTFQTVTYTVDGNPPTLTCSPSKTINCNETVSFDPPTVTDDCDQNPTVIVLVADDVVGNVHTRTWKATDASGNSVTCSQSVTINGSQLAMELCSHTDPSTPNGNDGSVSAGAVTGAAGTVTYTWTNSSNQVIGNTATVTGLGAGTYNLVVTDACASVTCTQTIVPLRECGGFRTQTIGGWGASPNGGNPGTYLHNNFAGAFPSGLTVGCTNKLVLSTAQDVTDFLPSGGTPRALPAGTLTNPAGTYSNTFASQVVALALSIQFDLYDASFGSSATHLQDLLVVSGPFAGETVLQVFTEANNALGGCSSGPHTISQLNDALTNINQNYDGGTISGNYLTCCGGLTMTACTHTDLPCNSSCHNGATGSVSAGTVSGASGNVTYTWKNSSGTVVGTTPTVSGLGPDTYTLVVTDNCSQVSCTTTISQPSAMVMGNCSHTSPSCGGGTGSVSAGTVTGAQGTVNYVWKNSQGQVVGTTATVSGLAAGTYSLTVSDNCSQLTCSQTISSGSTMTMGNCSHTDLPCNSSCHSGTTGSVSAGAISNATGTVYYTWKNSANQVVGTTATVTGLGAGTYTLTVHDNCTTLTCSQTISQPTAISMGNCSHTNPTCSGGTGSVTAGSVTGAVGNVTYVWKNSNGQTVGTSATVSGLPAGTYTLTVSDNCSSLTCSQTITCPPAMTMSSCSHTDLQCNSSCHNGSAGSVSAGGIANAQGTVYYTWKNSSGQVVGTTATVTGLGAGTYTLTVHDNCTTLTCSQTITQPSAMVMGNCSHTDLQCNSSCHSGNLGSVTAGPISNAQGTVHYTWKNSSGQVVGTTATVTGLGAGTYTLSVTDNCSSLTCSQTITQPSALAMGACSHTDATCTCSTGSVTAGTITAHSGTVTYVWKNSSGHTVGTTSTVTGLAAGTYNLTVSDNCSQLTCSQTIVASSGPVSCSIVSQPTGGCSSTGGDPNTLYLGYGPQSTKLVASATGTGPFTYSWTPSSGLSSTTSATPTFTPSAGGLYTFTVTVRNSSGCTSTCDITICVLDIRVPARSCGSHSYGSLVYLCHHSSSCGGGTSTSTISVSTSDVSYYLSHYPNDRLGSCSQSCGSAKDDDESLTIVNGADLGFDVVLYPNPFTSQFHILIQSSSDEAIGMRIFDVTGQLVNESANVHTNDDMLMGSQLAKGVYFVEVKQGEQKKLIRIVKSE